MMQTGGGSEESPTPALAPSSAGDGAAGRVVRSEVGPDGKLVVYSRVEIRFPNGDLYLGETANGKREGRGTYHYANADVYVGEFRADVFHGVGVLRKAPFTVHGRSCTGRCYQGDFQDGVRCGRGKYSSGFGDSYEGGFVGDAFEGQGSMVYANGDRYEGAWVRGRREGRGVCVRGNGDTYEGSWRSNAYHGDGVLRYSGGQGSYSGAWSSGHKHGIGKRVYASAAEYEGEYVRDERCGRGVFKSSMGDLYVGTFKDDRFSGEGTLILAGGDRYQGQFLRGQFCGVGRYEWEAGGYYEGEYAAQVRCGPPGPDKTFSTHTHWYWRAWSETARTHMYDPITGELISVRGRKVKNGRYVKEGGGSPSALSVLTRASSPRSPTTPSLLALRNGSGGGGEEEEGEEVIEEEVRDPKRVPTRTRLAQAEAARAHRRAREEADKRAYEIFLGHLTGAQRARALERWNRKHSKKPEDFVPPLLVGTPYDTAYLEAGGLANGTLGPAADGKRHGRGVRVWSDGSRYEGEWFQDTPQGFGVYVGSGVCGVRYEGEWRNGLRHGVGVESYGNNDGDSFRCPLGNMHKTAARCFYDGPWVRGLYEGEGTFTCCDGRQYFGSWVHGKRNGYGRWVMLPAPLQYAAVRGFDGSPELQGLDLAEGDPLLRDPVRARVYEGHFAKNKRSGLARQTLNNGDVHEGLFINGRLHGIGRITFRSGKVVFAMFEMGRRAGWVRGKGLKDLEVAWDKELLAERERKAAHDASLALLEDVNAFGLGTLAEQRIEKEALAKLREKETLAAAAVKPKNIRAGAFNVLTTSTVSSRL